MSRTLTFQDLWLQNDYFKDWVLLFPFIFNIIAAMGAIFGMTTCISAQIRDEPDSPANYFIGGCASGVFLGARTHSPMTGTMACVGLGTVAMLTKVGKMEGWKLTGSPKL